MKKEKINRIRNILSPPVFAMTIMTENLILIPNSNLSESVDPIYHTIKCAASLSSSTADISRRGSVGSSTSSVGSPKRSGGSGRTERSQSPAMNDGGNFLTAPDSPSRRAGTPKSAPHRLVMVPLPTSIMESSTIVCNNFLRDMLLFHFLFLNGHLMRFS